MPSSSSRLTAHPRPRTRLVLPALVAALVAMLLPLGLPSPSYAADGTISGHVTTTGSDLPSELRVEIWELLGEEQWLDWGEVPVAADGSYQVSLPSGDYKVAAYDRQGNYAQTYFADATTLEAADVVTVDGDVTGIDLTLQTPPFGTVSGTVTDHGSGVALGGVSVTAWHLVDLDGWWRWDRAETVATNAQGGYELTLPADTYRIRFHGTPSHVGEYYDDVATLGSAVDVVVARDQREVADAALHRKGWIEGTVTAQAGGAPLTSITAAIFQLITDDEGWTDWEQVGGVRTNAQGRYRWLGDPGSYRLVFFDPAEVWDEEFYENVPTISQATDVSITAPDTGTGGIDAALTRPGWLTGTVTSSLGGHVLPGAYVEAYRNVGTESEPDWSSAGDTTAGSSGSYRLRLGAGRYRIYFAADTEDGNGVESYYGDVGDIDDALDVAVTDAGVTSGINGVLAVPPGPAPQLDHAPTISGSARVGATLTATPGIWRPTPVSYLYQWLSDGVAVPGATARTFRVPGSQVGKRLSVRVTAVKPGRLPGTATTQVTPAVTVHPTVSVTGRATGTSVLLTVRVAAAGLRSVGGTVSILRGRSTVLKGVTVIDGKATVRLSRQPRGRWTFVARYLGRSLVLPATGSVRIRV